MSESLSEFALIHRLTAAYGGMRTSPEGPGDDSAILREADGRVVCMDTMVEDVHFSLAWSTWGDVGWKLVASNVSDIFAMGAEPTAMLLSLALPGRGIEARVVQIAKGMRAGADVFAPQLALIGGDLTRTRSTAVLTATVIGRSAARPWTRSGAEPGMKLWLNAEPGWAAAGLDILRSGRGGRAEAEDSMPTGPEELVALRAHRRPEPRRVSVDAEKVGAAIDISDGLAADALHVAKASGVQLVFHAPLPGAERLVVLAGGDEERARYWQVHGGDDYALLVAAAGAPDSSFQHVGMVESGRASVWIESAAGTRIELKGGFDHFRSTEQEA